MQVCLVSLPFQNIENPVLSLSLLKSCLEEKNIPAGVLYANLDFAARIGLKAYYAIVLSGNYRELLLGEEVFAPAVFKQSAEPYLEFMYRELAPYLGAGAAKELEDFVLEAQQAVEAFLDEVVEEVLQTGANLVACSSTTQQNCACLAFFKRLKERAPQIITILGGPNCEREMGKALAEGFPWLDYVVSGEADSFWGEFCQKLLAGQREFPEYPYIFTAAKVNQAEAIGYTEQLDRIPLPDYQDYFTSLAGFPFAKEVKVGLLIETSRGCWWGEKNPCTFCGITGSRRTYRTKSPKRVQHEFAVLAERYGIRRFFAVDCVLAREFWQSVLPGLAPLQLHIMYEIRTSTTREQLKALKTAGVSWVQPGIESVQDSLLELMNKGNRAIKHVELLKNLSRLGLRCCWILLCDFPGEDSLWYEEQLELLKSLTYLQPPDAVYRLRYDRFSVYQQRAEEYGLKLKAAPAYYYIYPSVYHSLLKDLCYFFEDGRQSRPVYAQGFTKPVQLATFKFVENWRRTFNSSLRDRLNARLKGDCLEVVDLRRGSIQNFYQLTGCHKAVALAAERVITLTGLEQALDRTYTSEEVADAVIYLQTKRLMVRIKNEILFLPLLEELPLPDLTDPPAGSISPSAFKKR